MLLGSRAGKRLSGSSEAVPGKRIPGWTGEPSLGLFQQEPRGLSASGSCIGFFGLLPKPVV